MAKKTVYTYLAYSADGSTETKNLSNYLANLNFETAQESPEATAMTNTTRVMIPGLKTVTLNFTLRQDFAANSVDPVLWPIFNNATILEWWIRPKNEAKSSTNPEYYFTGFITKYPPLSGNVGDVHDVEIEVVAAETSFGSPNVQRRTS